MLVAEATAREIGKVSLVEALELTALVARKQPQQLGVRLTARNLSWTAPEMCRQVRLISPPSYGHLSGAFLMGPPGFEPGTNGL